MYRNPEDVELPDLNEHEANVSAPVASAMLSNFLCSMITWGYIPAHHVGQALDLAAIGRNAAKSGPSYPAVADSV